MPCLQLVQSFYGILGGRSARYRQIFFRLFTYVIIGLLQVVVLLF